MISAVVFKFTTFCSDALNANNHVTVHVHFYQVYNCDHPNCFSNTERNAKHIKPEQVLIWDLNPLLMDDWTAIKSEFVRGTT